MPSLRCPHCQVLMKVKKRQSATTVRCPRCRGVLHRPAPENEDTTPYQVKSSSKKKQRSADVQDFVKDLEIQAQRDEERKPYRRGGFPFRKVPGIIILAGGMGLLLKVFSRGARFEPQLFLIILGAAVLIIVGLVALLK